MRRPEDGGKEDELCGLCACNRVRMSDERAQVISSEGESQMRTETKDVYVPMREGTVNDMDLESRWEY